MPNISLQILQKPHIKELLDRPVIAHLATANPKTCQPHVVPVWFLWDGDSIFISAFSSTRKVREVTLNPRISILIETDDAGKALLMEGKAELLTETTLVHDHSINIYSRYAGEKGLTDEMKSWANDPENTIIKLTPTRIFSWG
jgi:PPOX class probable F420-dependent enzyme